MQENAETLLSLQKRDFKFDPALDVINLFQACLLFSSLQTRHSWATYCAAERGAHIAVCNSYSKLG